MSLSGYFSFRKITFRLSHSSANRSDQDERQWARFNSDVIRAMQIMLDIHAGTFLSALRNTSTQLLETTCVTLAIRGIKIFRNNLPFLRNAVESWTDAFFRK